MVFIHLFHYKVYLTALKISKIEMDSLGNILYHCTLLHIICEHLHDLYTLNSLSGWKKGLKKSIPRDSFNSSLIYILFSMFVTHSYVNCTVYSVHGCEVHVFTWTRNYFLSIIHCYLLSNRLLCTLLCKLYSVQCTWF